MEKDAYITTTEACKLLGVSKTVIKRMADEGELETWKTPGGHRRLKRASVMHKMEEENIIPSSSQALKLLIIDDDPTTLKVLEGYAKSAGFDVEVTTALDGYHGLIQAGQGVFDLIFVDLNMPKLDGYGAVSALKALETTQSSTIFVITAEEKVERDRLPEQMVVLHKPLQHDVIAAFMQYEYRLKNC